MAWLLWANTVAGDAPNLKRRIAFPPPEEVGGDWVAQRKLCERLRRPRTNLKPSEMALLMDVGDYLLELRSLEEQNASTMECMLHAALVLWELNAQTETSGHKRIYRQLRDEWGVMPPDVSELPDSRDAVRQLCRGLMREEDLVPTWYMRAMPIPRNQSSGDEEAAPAVPKAGDLFGDA